MIHISMKMMILYKIIRSMPCFFKEVTHFYCPACGGTRSVIALLHLDIERAFLCNPTVVYTGVMFLWCIAGWMVKKLTAREMKSMKLRLWMLILGVCNFFGYAVIINILLPSSIGEPSTLSFVFWLPVRQRYQYCMQGILHTL